MKYMLKGYESYPCKVELGLNTNIVPLLFILCPQDLNLRWLQRAEPRVSSGLDKENVLRNANQ